MRYKSYSCTVFYMALRCVMACGLAGCAPWAWHEQAPAYQKVVRHVPISVSELMGLAILPADQYMVPPLAPRMHQNQFVSPPDAFIPPLLWKAMRGET